MNLDRISIELSNRCAKACSFCYNASVPDGKNAWLADEVIDFLRNCADNGGIKAVSFGGGEPLQYGSLFDVLDNLKGLLFRSITTNGLLLDRLIDDLVAAQPDKVHVSIHFPEDTAEVTRVIEQVTELAHRGVRSGINFLVAASKLDAAISAAEQVRQSGIANERIVYLPMRPADTPSPDQLARVAGGKHFQSMSCLLKCMASPRFCSLASDKTVAWCSYSEARRQLPELTYRGLVNALTDLNLIYCGDTNARN